MNPEAPNLSRARPASMPEVPRLRKPVDQMAPDELCGEASKMREHIATAAERLGEIYATLYTTVRQRRTAASELSTGEVYAYTSVAKAGQRLAGIVLQAVKRTSYIDRLVENAKTDAEQAERDRRDQEKEIERRTAVKAATERREREFSDRLFGFDPQVTQDDLIELYGND